MIFGPRSDGTESALLWENETVLVFLGADGAFSCLIGGTADVPPGPDDTDYARYKTVNGEAVSKATALEGYIVRVSGAPGRDSLRVAVFGHEYDDIHSDYAYIDGSFIRCEDLSAFDAAELYAAE